LVDFLTAESAENAEFIKFNHEDTKFFRQDNRMDRNLLTTKTRSFLDADLTPLEKENARF